MSSTRVVNNNHDPVSEIHEVMVQRLSIKSISTDLNISVPAAFYHSHSIYQLEKRAIFSRRWFLVSHKARYRNTGDFVQYEMAGFNFVVVKNKEGDLVGFHNICRCVIPYSSNVKRQSTAMKKNSPFLTQQPPQLSRHRAFPVVREPQGTARIFSCKYHGWSYDLNGKLTKAPRFTPESVPTFDPSAIHLFPVHVHVDRNGFVYVNLDANPDPAISWGSQYGDLDRQQVLLNSGIDWDKVEYDFTWTNDGAFNWKVMQDNYNEVCGCVCGCVLV